MWAHVCLSDNNNYEIRNVRVIKRLTKSNPGNARKFCLLGQWVCYMSKKAYSITKRKQVGLLLKKNKASGLSLQSIEPLNWCKRQCVVTRVGCSRIICAILLNVRWRFVSYCIYLVNKFTTVFTIWDSCGLEYKLILESTFVRKKA